MADNQEGIFIDGNKKKSIENLQTVDLLCEGPIDGLITQEFTYVGTLGNVGWDTVTKQPAKNFLSSVYLNDTPVMDQQGLYNFQNIQTNNSFGLANGFVDSKNILLDSDMQSVGTKDWDLRPNNSKATWPAKVNKVQGLSWPNKSFKEAYKVRSIVEIDRDGLRSTSIEPVKFGKYSMAIGLGSHRPSAGKDVGRNYLQVRDSNDGIEGFDLWSLQTKDVTLSQAHKAEALHFQFDAWLYPVEANLGNGLRTIFSHGYYDEAQGMAIMLKGVGGDRYTLGFVNNGSWLWTHSSIPGGSWSHIRVMLAGRNVALWIDGEKQQVHGAGSSADNTSGYYPYIQLDKNAGGWGNTPFSSANRSIWIGTNRWYPHERFAGWMDNVKYSTNGSWAEVRGPTNDRISNGFTPGREVTDGKTFFLLDAEEWEGTGGAIVPVDNSGIKEVATLINGSRTIEATTFSLQYDSIRADGEFYDTSKCNNVITSSNGAAGPLYKSSGGPPNEEGGTHGYLEFNSNSHNESTADMLILGEFNYGPEKSTVPVSNDYSRTVPIPTKPLDVATANPTPSAFLYNGSTGYMGGASMPGFPKTYPMQIEFWYNAREINTGDWRWIAGVAANRNNTEYTWAFWQHPSNGHLYFYYNNVLNAGAFNVLPAGNITLNQWHHIAITFDEFGIRSFFDGEQVGFARTTFLFISRIMWYDQSDTTNKNSRFAIGARPLNTVTRKHSHDMWLYNFRILQGMKTYGGNDYTYEEAEGAIGQDFFTPSAVPFAGVVSYDDDNLRVISSNPINKQYTLRAQRSSETTDENSADKRNGSFAQEVTVEENLDYTMVTKAGGLLSEGNENAAMSLVIWKDDKLNDVLVRSNSGDNELFYPVLDGNTMSSTDSKGRKIKLSFNSGSSTSAFVGAQLAQKSDVIYFDDFELVNDAGFTVSKVRQIRENLRGPTVDKDGNPTGDNYSVDMFAKKYRIVNKDCIKADLNLRIDRLYQQDGGNTVDWNISNIVIKYRPLFNSSSSEYIDAIDEEITGMTQSGFVKRYNLDFSKALSDITPALKDFFYGWEIKIWRTSPESTITSAVKQTSVDSLVEYYDTNMVYPNSAVSVNSFNAEYFASVPARSFDVRMLKVKVPSNYNPIKKSYDESTGPWDGTFLSKKVWTDNPAWCFYDLVTNPRYGLGEYIPESGFDKWTLYKIAQYCDTIVADGAGGMEPRMTLNVVINTREDAYKVINDMSSVFRGILYYAAGQIYAIQDSPKLPIYSFTNANVEDGNFTYNNTSRKSRHNVCIVRYNDKTNFYRPAIEYVEDIDGIRANGIREQELTAFGCTSRGQAIRLGKWLVYTENLEIESVTFNGGPEVSVLKPGDNISVTDANRLSSRRGGRTVSITGDSSFDTVTLDSEIDPNYLSDQKVYNLSLLTPTFSYDSYNVSGMDSSDTPNIRRSQVQDFLFSGQQVSTVVGSDNVSRSEIALNEPISWKLISGIKRIDSSNYHVSQNSVFSIYPTGEEFEYGRSLSDSTDLEKVFRIVNITEQEKNKFKVQAVQNTVDKYEKIEDDLKFLEAGLYNSPTLRVPLGPSAVALNLEQVTDNTVDIKYTISPPPDKGGLDSYHVFVSKDEKFPIVEFTGNYPYLYNEFTGSSASGMKYMLETPINQVVSSGQDLIPDLEHRVAVVPASTEITKTYRPQNSGEFAFRVFSANSMSEYSNKGKLGSIYVPFCDPIQDIQVENLRLADDPVFINRGGLPDAAKTEYTGGSPEILWTSSLAGSGIVNSDINYRITVRDQASDDSDVPSDVILFEVTGYKPVATSNVNLSGFSYIYSLSNNLTHTTGKRDYDIVVEAHDSEGSTSAGGTFGKVVNAEEPFIQNERGFLEQNYINIDSRFNNPSGFDIVRLRNTKIDDPYLSTSPEDCRDDSNICTTQIISLDNKVKLVFSKNTHETNNRDVLGGYMYMSPRKFDVSGVQGKKLAELPHDMERVPFTYAESVEVIPTGDMLLDGSVFMAYSLYDTFDAEKNVIYLSDVPDNSLKDLNFELASELAVSIPREVKLDDMNTVSKIVKGGTQSISFDLPTKRQWKFIKIEGSLQGKRVTYSNTVNQQAEKWQERSQLNNWKIYVNDIQMDSADNWTTNPPASKTALFCSNSKWNGSTDELSIYNIQAKGCSSRLHLKMSDTLTVRSGV